MQSQAPICRIAEMAMKEQSFVLKRGEGLHNKNLIQHTVLNVETPRASNVDSTGVALKNGKPIMKTSYVSPMARARQLAKQRREAAASSDSTGASKDWDESIPSSSSPSNSESAVSSLAGTPSVSKPSVQRLIPSSGHIPKSGYIPKSGTVYGEETGGSGRLPKFGVWDNNNNDGNGPCYTLLFENVAQEKRSGGQIRIHAQRPCSPSRNEDLYNYNPTSIKAARKTRQYHTLLCCFVGS